MTRRPARPCPRPGCPGLVRAGTCSVCGPSQRTQRARDYDAERGNAHQRGYGARWQKLRGAYLRANPLCVDCAQHGRTTAANEVDHILPKRLGGTDEWENLQPLCKSCHSRKTARESTTSAVDITIIAGPPASGKTTYVREHMRPGDLVVDVDALYTALSGLPWYDKPAALLPFVIEARDAVLNRLLRQSDVRSAWVITGEASPPKLRGIQARYHAARILVLDVSETECMRRIANDERRADKIELWRPLVRQWFDEFHRSADAVTPGGRGVKSL